MKPIYAEPPDLSIVGYGSPIVRAYVRMDAWTPSSLPMNRWFETHDQSTKEALTWEEVTDARHYGAPYLLTPSPIEEVAHGW